METASIKELRASLKDKTPQELLELCVQLAKYKKENKEYLTYLIYESPNEAAYIEGVKRILAEEFATLERSNFYHLKKSIRKALRICLKYIRYSKKKETEAELRLFFCTQLVQMEPSLKRSIVLKNIYYQQLKMTRKAVDKLHEDLQFDYEEEISALEQAYRNRTL